MHQPARQIDVGLRVVVEFTVLLVSPHVHGTRQLRLDRLRLKQCVQFGLDGRPLKRKRDGCPAIIERNLQRIAGQRRTLRDANRREVELQATLGGNRRHRRRRATRGLLVPRVLVRHNLNVARAIAREIEAHPRHLVVEAHLEGSQPRRLSLDSHRAGGSPVLDPRNRVGLLQPAQKPEAVLQLEQHLDRIGTRQRTRRRDRLSAQRHAEARTRRARNEQESHRPTNPHRSQPFRSCEWRAVYARFVRSSKGGHGNSIPRPGTRLLMRERESRVDEQAARSDAEDGTFD